MTTKSLASLFSLSRRYTRSINLERDLNDPTSLAGYVVTGRAEEALIRIGDSLIGHNPACAWMLTGVYGTGKSAFGLFLSALCAAPNSHLRAQAVQILRSAKVARSLTGLWAEESLAAGLVVAAAAGQREPVAQTVLRALRTGVANFWKPASRNATEFTPHIERLLSLLAKGKPVENSEVLQLIIRISAASGTGVLLLLDELGKCLEYAAHHRGAGDLYLLQQIAELPADSSVRMVGLLHQAFSEYGYGLGTVERNEWAKIQGRFEEIPFTEAPSQMTRLIGEVIRRADDRALARNLKQHAAAWHQALQAMVEVSELTEETIAKVFPLHPVAALALPHLCVRYAQNDRSLFTFLTSNEPHSLQTFLNETKLADGARPLVGLDRLYDYFTDTMGAGLSAQPRNQRWAEIRNLIEDHRRGDQEEMRLLKTVGALNLISTGGEMKATHRLVTLALCNDPTDKSEQRRYEQMLDRLVSKRVLLFRRAVDELRLWEGSDFDLESTLNRQIEQERTPLAQLLNDSCPLRPQVAQRHSYETGTLRYFERKYIDSTIDLTHLICEQGGDGLIGYWLEEKPPASVPALTADQRPFVMVAAKEPSRLRLRAQELSALRKILSSTPELQTDGIARREVRHRLVQAQQMLEETLKRATDSDSPTDCWIGGQAQRLCPDKELKSRLSDLCNEVYEQGLKLRNELINRRELTSQGAKASRQVITAMLESAAQENLGFVGAGPEVSVYHSVLRRTGIHRQVDGVWDLHPPLDSGIQPVWLAIENFCLNAKGQTRTLDELYRQLQLPPYGVRAGMIPILLAAVILRHTDDVSVYKDSSFIPLLGAEHFELMVKHPARFAVKHFEMLGVRAQFFREIETVLSSRPRLPQQIRNRTLLGVVSPLLQFARRLPPYAQKTSRLSTTAQAVRKVLLESNEPDQLLFELMPQACGLQPISDDDLPDPSLPAEFRQRLAAVLKELQEVHERLLLECRTLIHAAFGVRQDEGHLREDLRSRASYLQGRSIEPILTRFVYAATDEAVDDQQWLLALVMVIADKPSESWGDADVDGFELKLADVARRFKHLEAIIKDNSALWHSQAEARRISVIRTDGTEYYDIAWIDEAQRQILEGRAEAILQQLSQELDPSQQRALLALLSEKILHARQTATLFARQSFRVEADKIRRRNL